MSAPQVISKERVTNFGEVMTAEREVEAMLDLVQTEASRVDATFLEPACGNGNFLVAILNRKLQAVAQECGADQSTFSSRALAAVSSIYGIDIQADNVAESRARLLGLLDDAFGRVLHDADRRTVMGTAFDRVQANVVWGDFLTMKRCGPDAGPIDFTNWRSAS